MTLSDPGDSQNFSLWLTDTARKLGAHSVACLSLDNPVLKRRLAEAKSRAADWLQRGQQGEMDYLQQTVTERFEPCLRFSTAKTVMIVTFGNKWGDPVAKNPFPAPHDNTLIGYISAYARDIDYHKTGTSLLQSLANKLEADQNYEICVDTKPVEERLLAEVAGLGVIGGNNLLRVPGRGDTRIFIGCLFLDKELPEVIHQPILPFSCGECRKCVNNCPSGALQYGKAIEARKCISYLTMEKKDILAREEGQSIGAWLFGCDCCTSVCPETTNIDMRIPVDLQWLLESSAGEIRRIIKNSAVNYAGVTKLRRNAVVVLKNLGTPQAQQLLNRVRETTGSDLIRRQIDLW